MIVDTIIRKDDGDYIRFKNSQHEDNKADATVEIRYDSPDLDPEFFFVHLELKDKLKS